LGGNKAASPDKSPAPLTRLDVHLNPRSSRNALKGWREGVLEVAVTAPPVDGQANEALCAVLAQALGIKARQIQVVAGPASRRKIVEIRGLDAPAVHAILRP
jgi:uncharacterized protein (TIGR00251 family)